MIKRIILLALAAVSASVLALPATATAITPLHLVPKPEGTKLFEGGPAVLRGSFGSVGSTSISGAVGFSSTTTGTIALTFKGFSAFGVTCQSPGQPSGVVVTTSLEFHLATVVDTPTGATGPGVLLTTNAGHFATFECGFFGKFVLGGLGLIGTITNVACGGSSAEPNLTFSPVSASSSVQTHKTLVGTTTEYNLTTNGGESSLEMSGRITLGTSSKLECT
jgi:hypothetical protein